MKGLITHQNGIKITLNEKHLSKRCIKKSYLNCPYLTKAEPPNPQIQPPLTPLQRSCMFGRKWNPSSRR